MKNSSGLSQLFGLLIITNIALTALASECPPTVGPNGETPTPVTNLNLSWQEKAKIKAGHYTAALVWHELSDYTNAVDRGARDEFKKLGIKVVAQTNASFDPARQKTDVETVMAKSPSIIVSLPVDSTTASSVYDVAKKAGVSLSFIDIAPKGYVQGRDYAAITSDDLHQMGRKVGEAMGNALNGKGKVGWIYHDADFYVTNQRDKGFKCTIKKEYPNINIVAEAGMADSARIDDIAHAMLTRHPDLDGIYVPWSEPALGVLSVLRELGNHHTKIVTFDLSEPLALDMIHDGNTYALVADQAYLIGVTAAKAGAAKLIHKKIASYYVVGAVTVTGHNISEGWMESLYKTAPAKLTKK